MKRYILVMAAACVGMAVANTDGLNIPSDFAAGDFAYQNTSTGFGNNFNELNGLFLRSNLGTIFMGATANLEQNNGNRIIIAMDTKAGGATQMPGSFGFTSGQDHLFFGGGFAVDYVLHMNIFNGIMYIDLYDVQGNNNMYLGGTQVNGSGGWDPGQGGMQPGSAAFNNTNTAGVGGGNGIDGNAPTATTGLEIELPWNLMGLNENEQFCAMAYITGGDGFFSNQFVPGIGGGDNIGRNNYTQNSYVCHTLVPEPASMFALGIGMGALALRRRRR